MTFEEKEELESEYFRKINERFSHHRKLIVGNKYQHFDGYSDVLYIYDLDKNPLGFYSKELFADIDIYREEQINKILK